MSKILSLILALFVSSGNAQIINPQQPTAAGAGLTRSGNSISVNYGTGANTALQGNALGAANGVATLDGSGKITASTIPVLSPTVGGAGVANNAASTLAISGAFGTTLNLTGTTNVTLPTSGTLLSTGAPGNYVSSAIGTTNQVNVSSAVGDVTFSLPQSIATSSAPTFNALTLSGSASGGLLLNANYSGTAASLQGTETSNAASIKYFNASGTLYNTSGSPALSQYFSLNPTLRSDNTLPKASFLYINQGSGSGSGYTDVYGLEVEAPAIGSGAVGSAWFKGKTFFGSAQTSFVDGSGIMTLNTALASGSGGTGNAFTKFTGPASTEKTFTLPNASSTILTSNAAVTPAQGGTGTATVFTAGSLVFSGASGIYTQANSNAFFDSAAKSLGIGNFATSPDATLTLNANSAATSSPSFNNTYVHVVGSASASPAMMLDAFGGGANYYASRSAQGTPSSPTQVLSGYTLLQLGAMGRDNVAYTGVAAGLDIYTTQDWTSSAHGTRLILSTTANGSTAKTDRLTIDSSGNTTVAGGFLLPGIAAGSGATTGTLCWTTGTGNVTVNTTLACLASARRFKQNIEPLDTGIDSIMRLRPVSYELKPEYDPQHLGRQVGLIAEDVEEVDKRLVGYGSDGKIQGVRYMQMTALLVKAVQDQQRQIVQLRHKIDSLKSR